MGGRVLVVEDDASLNEIVCTFLNQEGYTSVPVFSGSEARLVIEEATRDCVRGTGFNLIITDLMLPGMPGEELVPFARARLGDIPIIVTSAKGAVSDRVALLRTGADDYLVKPFDLDELVARAEALFRRAQGGATTAHGCEDERATDPEERVLAFGTWRLSPETRTFTVAGAPVRLTRTEFDLLATLMEHPDRVFTKRELYTLCCTDDPALIPTVADEKTVVTHMGNLRAKLKASGTDGLLETVWGIGFKLRH